MQIINLLLAASAAGFAAAGPLTSANTNAVNVIEKRATFPIPASKGNVKYSKTYTITKGKTFDGGFKTYGRGVSCTGQSEGGNADAVFILEEGATLANAIIGKDQIEGVHCLGSCTIKNVWWSAVCEDALSLKGKGNANVQGGGAIGASDKVIQHNGSGTVTINGFNVQNFGKLYRSCGNCKGNGAAKKVVMTNVKAYSGKALAGINSNYGDTATIGSTNCATSVKSICNEYTGNNNGKEPPLKSTGASAACKISALKAC